jgi:DNA-directed RNA polymerase subunit RPC12/RpoP
MATDDPRDLRCPRCGGRPAPPRRVTAKNPFLPSAARVTCADCGLEFEEDERDDFDPPSSRAIWDLDDR